MTQHCRTELTVEQRCVQFDQLSYSSLPHFPLTLAALLPWLSPVYSGVSWQHAAPSVPGYVQANSGRGGDLHGGDAECIQPSPHCTPQIWPEGRIILLVYSNMPTCIAYTQVFVFVTPADSWILQTITSTTPENLYNNIHYYHSCNHSVN